MGQEIDNVRFSEADFDSFHTHLEQETRRLETLIANNQCSSHRPVAGFEIESWLVDDAMNPAPINERFLALLDNPLASPELAKFNVELNNEPVVLSGDALSCLHRELQEIWSAARDTADKMGVYLIMIGTLPTLKQHMLNLSNMSDLNRYRALNEQILQSRGKPIRLEISGNQHLKVEHQDVMLESATTSFQIHLQTPLESAHHAYNASIIASAPMVAACANAPFLFGMDLWAETRIPLFEQSIEVGGYNGAAHGPLRRVSFGSGYARESIMECFEENLQHFPVLLPVQLDTPPEKLEYLRLHNGTIWRWNRPLVGFDPDGTPHIRIEQRVAAAGPTIIDMLVNAAFFYGLAENLTHDVVYPKPRIPFDQARDNFYQAARNGLNGQITWINREKVKIQTLLLNDLLPRARAGLSDLGITASEADHYLDIMERRVESGINGCEWQRRYVASHGANVTDLTRAYLENQRRQLPVHEWPLC